MKTTVASNGRVYTTNKQSQIVVRMSDELKVKLQHIALTDDRGLSSKTRMLLEQSVADWEKANGGISVSKSGKITTKKVA